MDSTIPQDLLDLKDRIEHWRNTRRFSRQAMPPELRDALAEALSRHRVCLIKRALKLNPRRFRPSPPRPPAATRSVDTTQQVDFLALSLPSVPAPSSPCHLRIDRNDGSHILVTVPSSGTDLIRAICSDFLSGACR